jgi:hypothetical protein
MMTTEMDIETSVYYVHLTRLIAREDFIMIAKCTVHATIMLLIINMYLNYLFAGSSTVAGYGAYVLDLSNTVIMSSNPA